MTKLIFAAIGLSMVAFSVSLFGFSSQETRLERGSLEPYYCPGCYKWVRYPHACKG